MIADSFTLSDIELYYSPTLTDDSDNFQIDDEESSHIIKVMRHRPGDEIFITNGMGKIFQCQINKISKIAVTIEISRQFSYPEKFPNVTICIPMLRNSERLEFAFEKSTELGITNFIIFNSERSVQRKINKKRVEKILISSIKQSLQSWLPKVEYLSSTDKMLNSAASKIIFDHSSEQYFNFDHLAKGIDYYLIFGPEGGLTQKEINLFPTHKKYKLAENRLRTETAIIKAVSLL